MAIFRGDTSFDGISPSIFRLETTWDNGKKSAHGTAFVVAMLRDSRRLVLATAKHVLDFPENETVWWKARQFDEHGRVQRQISFGTDHGLLGGVPYRVHKKFDIGVLVLPANGDDKGHLARPGETPVRVIAIDEGVSTGTRIAWAGFPAVMEDLLGFPQLCYFEGVVSAMVNDGKRPFYIVDGHVSEGVSGGPVWQWNEEKSRLEVVGIVVSYTPGPSRLPGFCQFEPINPIMYFLETEAWHPDTLGDHLITNRRG